MSSTGTDRDATRRIDPVEGSRGAEPSRPRETARPRPSWRDRVAGGPDPAAVIGTIVGVFLLVIAIVTLARTGIPANDLTAGQTVVGWFTRTPLMGIIELLAGLAFLGLGTAGDGRGLAFLGLVAFVFGIVWLIEPGAFQSALGIGRPTAWLYLLIGIASSAAVFIGTGGPRRTTYERRIEV